MSEVSEKKLFMSKSVQEMSVAGDQPPPEYVASGCKYAPDDMSSYSSSTSFPVIDISLFSQSSDATNNELNSLKSALTSLGCFQVVGHGISSSFLDKVRGIAHGFFELPIEEKQKYARAPNDIEGYGSDRVVSQNQILDWSHRLSLKVIPQDIRRLNLWPQYPLDFGEILEEYSVKIKSILDILYKAMARCTRPDLVLGIKPHTDKSGLTVLLQDKQTPGFQLLVNHKWLRVPLIDDALVINLGDLMQIMSNGIFKSPMHRVVTNAERMRISLVFFHEPEPDLEIGAVDDFVSEERPKLYKNVKNYVAVHYKCYNQGIVPLDTVKIV
ncbi:2-oxoglutarate (2OG) and Fe(II)-dependent oxygenase superfamily protein [Euphorbia peplus]|nr:2-oxoglutarate (2OG) and Fe(II)-dependent oxygenase superfamily protein [Euphorbia peplus]